VRPVLTLTPKDEKMANTLRVIQEFFNGAYINGDEISKSFMTN
jgi:hypothetical protein